MHRVFLIFAIASCSSPKRDPSFEIVEVKECTATAEQRTWVLECVRVGNPMSDEEGEDLVDECLDSSEDLFRPACTYVEKCRRSADGDSAEVPMRHCEKVASSS